MEFPQVDNSEPADAPLGRLQRGRGAGWLDAVDTELGAQWLLSCLTHEPRWDRQVESRAEYYASLALRLKVPVTSFAPDQANDDDDDAWIATEVIEEMARRGAADAVAFLQTNAFDAHDEARMGQADLATNDLRAPNGRWASADAPIDELLAVTWYGPYPKAVVHRLRTTRDPKEIDTLRRVALEFGHPGWHLAMHALGRRGDVSPLAAVEHALIADEPGRARATAFQFVRALPSELSLPLARSWLAINDGRGSVATAVLAQHSELADAPAIRSALARASDYYSMSSLIEALGRLPDLGPFPELHEIFVESAYSYTRARAVHAMAATDPSFANRWATECLWDCEEVIRMEGARFAPMDSTVRARLHELADDDYEDDGVRDAAEVRLRNAGSESRTRQPKEP